MCLQNACCYWRLVCRRYIKIHTTIKPYSSIANKKQNTLSSNRTKSTKYPDYQTIYVFPYIIYPRVLNILKRNQTIFCGISIPIIIALQPLGLISVAESINLIFCSCIVTVWVHGVCCLCNNFIGSIYFKKDNKEVILSYSNYWGKRIDLKTDVNNIIPLTETPLNVGHILYRKLNIKSHKQKLKINMPYGQIINKETFENVFGNT